MKKGLILCLALVLAFAMVASAVKIDRKATLVTKDGEAPAVKVSGAKLPSIGTIINATGYGDAWRGTASAPGKSICVSPDGQTIGTVFGVAGAACNMLFGYSLDGGANWSTQTIASNMNTRIYPGMAFDDALNPYIVWQDRTNNSIQWAMDEGGTGAGLWTTPDTLARDSVAWYLPAIGIRGNKMIMSGFAHALVTPAGTFDIHMVLSNDLGASWQAPWDRQPLPYGWNKWAHNELLGQGNDLDEADWIISASGDTILGFLDVIDADGLFRPAYKISYDGGITWTAMDIFSHMPQYTDGGWWYMYDGAWIGDKPYLCYMHWDGVWNGSGLFIYYPTVAGDYSNWTKKRIGDIPGNLAGVTPGDLTGAGTNFNTIAHDAAGNIYVLYNDYGRTSHNYEIFGVASTDGGATWLTPVQLTNENGELDGNYYMECAELVADGKVHMIFHNPGYTNLYYWSVPTATILAGAVRPEEINVAPALCGAAEGGWGGPVDATMDTLSAAGDTLVTFWGPTVAVGGTYEVQVCKDADFSSSDKWQYADAGLNVNYLLPVVGLPDTNVVWHWRVRAVKDAVYSPWSPVYDFYYMGTTVNTADWTNLGVAGTPNTPTAHKFSLNQNRPNPVNKVADLSFTLPKSGNYSLKIYNIAGQVIRTLDGKGTAGQNTVTWNGLDNGGRKVANGVYLYNLNAFGNSATKKLVVVR
jgi:hypothetical protein